MLAKMLRRYFQSRQLNKAYALLGGIDGEIEVSPETMLILWKGLRALRLSEEELLLLLPIQGDFYYQAHDVAERLEKGTLYFARTEEPPRTHYPPEINSSSLRFWLSDKQGSHLEAISFLLELEELIKDNVEAMDLSRETEAEHVYNYRIGEMYYVYCDIMTFCESILRRAHST
ncbi:hypothetical protein CF95_gp167 [Erwinia phage PhiEaH1]|uniref:Uncharacterized protein n=1 Tax=Erwinia phage PhiEaH1 TaxID=1401669 RepID=W8CZN9_9CAUD|nr:hypothetical protein CF95_gp167 [Erwinia phage PhiEaH1]AGX01881.1 hypothetical protein [Erwinia phage PhiEaH1]WBF04921.1 hypothetical protein [Erwinia phage vB_Ea277G]